MLDFLPDTLRALAFVLLALCGARIMFHVLKIPFDNLSAWFSAWILLTTAAFVSGHFVVFALVAAGVCVWLARKSPDDVPAIYVALLPLMPLYEVTIPGFLGIKRILSIDYQELLTLVLLIPALIAARQRTAIRSTKVRNGVDVMFFTYCAWLFFLAFVQRPSVTDSLRTAFEVVAFLLLPYLAVSRLIRSWAQFRSVILALVFSGLMVACIGMMEQRMTWHFYEHMPTLLKLDPVAGFAMAHEYRFGILRIKGSIDGGIGFFLVFALAGWICIWSLRMIKWWIMLIGLVAFALPIFFTGSRAAWIISALMIASTLAFSLIKSPGRFVFAAALGMFAIPVVQNYFLSTTDAFGTFDYRAELIRSAFPMVFERPILGWDGATELFANGRLEHMRQGMGIIDLVNSYLTEALFHGLPGVAMFAGILFASLWAVLRRHQRGSGSGEGFRPAAAAFLASMVIATAFLLVTISMVGHIPSYLFLLAALCSAFAALPDEADSHSSVTDQPTWKAGVGRSMPRRERPRTTVKRAGPSLGA
jgi:hypothetical protein